MKTLKNRNVTVLIIVLLVPWGASAAQAPTAKLPDYYPARFDGAGFVQSVDYHANTMMIDALSYRLAQNIPVHMLETQFASLPALRSGIEIGFTLQDGYSNDQRTITELWVLPAGSVIPH